MATIDDGVLNLQRFVGALATATRALETIGDNLEQSTRRLAEMEDEVGQEGGGLNDRLEDLESALDSGEQEARDALQEVEQAGTDGQDTAADARQKLDDAGTEVEDKSQAVVDDLDQAHAELTEKGFEALGQTIHEQEQELSAQSQETQQEFSDLETAVHGFESQGQAAWDDAEAELDEAVSDLAEGESALESAAAAAVQGFESQGDELETFCSSLESDVDLIYDALDSGVESQGQEWVQEMKRIAQEAVTFVETGTQQQLEEPARLVEDEALSALGHEYAAVGAVLDGAAETARELEPLAEELVKCQSVVGQIDELMNAVAE